MKCKLMHKRIAVAELLLDDTTGFIQKIDRVFQPEHLPVGVSVNKGIADRAALNEWWTDRSIPASRSGIREALETLDVTSTKMLLVRCYGLSLSDQYWIYPENSNLTWDQINFFENPFSDDMGDVLFGTQKKADGFDFSSPDNTSDGCLKKRWKILNGKRCLIKGGSNPFRQQPFNEVIAAGIMERLGIDHIPYTVMWKEDAPYSVCEDFVTADTELVSAWRIMQTQKKENSTSVYQHFVNCCKVLGAPNVVPSLDRMIILDYIIANEDRHLNNFGLLRNAETLEWLGFAPIFDSGSSLGYDKVAAQIRAGRDIACKPFKKHHAGQLKLVSSFDWIDFENLKDVESMITAVLSDEKNGEFIDESRISAIASAAVGRVQTLREIALTHAPNLAEITTEDDVEENIAEDYTPKMGM
ncbi:excisionase [Anaerotruncus colihominis]|uniref:Excisionase n=1 Tax=Anaerotruncus colihominis TaxID=169435 RepID=A0A1Y4MVU9_9FIRM|nr:HipA domain-containing protein [Anaerotruncus colihominis]OUP68441.1 excisionase [Anaerotruncus colihominis]OUP72818.1 excisionase [Anaerotruncus colihominis]